MTEDEPTTGGDLANAVNMIYNARRVSLIATSEGKIISAKLQYLKSVKITCGAVVSEEWEDCPDSSLEVIKHAESGTVTILASEVSQP